MSPKRQRVRLNLEDLRHTDAIDRAFKRRRDPPDSVLMARATRKQTLGVEVPQKREGPLIKKVFKRRKNSIGNDADARRISQRYTSDSNPSLHQKPSVLAARPTTPQFWEPRHVAPGQVQFPQSHLTNENILESAIDATEFHRHGNRRDESDFEHERDHRRTRYDFNNLTRPLYQRRNQHGRFPAQMFYFVVFAKQTGAFDPPRVVFVHLAHGSPFPSNPCLYEPVDINSIRTSHLALINGLPEEHAREQQVVAYARDPAIQPGAGFFNKQDPHVRFWTYTHYRHFMIANICRHRYEWLASMRSSPELRIPLKHDRFVTSLLSWPEDLSIEGPSYGYPGLDVFHEHSGARLHHGELNEAGVFWKPKQGIATQVWLCKASVRYQRLLLWQDAAAAAQTGYGILSGDEYQVMKEGRDMIMWMLTIARENVPALTWKDVIQSVPFGGLERLVGWTENE